MFKLLFKVALEFQYLNYAYASTSFFNSIKHCCFFFFTSVGIYLSLGKRIIKHSFCPSMHHTESVQDVRMSTSEYVVLLMTFCIPMHIKTCLLT